MLTYMMRLILLSLAAAFGGQAMAAEFCRDVEHLGAAYLVCRFDPVKQELRLYHSNHAARPYGAFRPMIEDAAVDRTRILFAMNAGMYHADLSPVGLYVENGIERQKISTGPGYGNFHLLPNGVFYMDQGKAGVLETQAYLASGLKPWYATQSGPMLVIDGKIHPAFLPKSDSLQIRNGVGIGPEGEVHAVISKERVRFHDLETLFRDLLGCLNAMFLDGSISSLYIPDMKREDRLYPMGPIFAVVESRPDRFKAGY